MRSSALRRMRMQRIPFRAENQAAQSVRRMHHIRIGKPEECRRFFGRHRNAFVERPQFSCPARRKRGHGSNRHAPRRAQPGSRLPRERGGSVFALIIDDEDFELTGIILACQTGDSAGNRFRFIASGNDGNHARPVFERLQRDVVFAESPEIPARQ